MPRPRKGARLYLRERPGRDPVYVILDGSLEVGTGCGRDRATDAERMLASYIAGKYEPPEGDKGHVKLSDILIADVMTAYLREHAPYTASAAWIGHSVKPVLDWWGAKTLADVKGKACRDYVDWRTRQFVGNTMKLRSDGTTPVPRMVSSATARHELTTLRAAIHHWHREHGPLPTLPAVTLPPPPAPRDRWLQRAEAASLLRAARSTRQVRHVARIVLIGLYTGTRSKALLALKWSPSPDGGWIDLEGGVIHRQPRGKRQTAKRQPPVRIPLRLLPHLRRWYRTDMKETSPPCVHVIHYAGEPIKKLRRSWARACGVAGLGRDVVPHILRHTAATWLMQAGVDVYEAAGFLGMSAEMLLSVYGHHHPDFQERAANADRGRRKAKR